MLVVYLLMQLRTRVLDGTLEADFKRWKDERINHHTLKNRCMNPQLFLCSLVRAMPLRGPSYPRFARKRCYHPYRIAVAGRERAQ